MSTTLPIGTAETRYRMIDKELSIPRCVPVKPSWFTTIICVIKVAVDPARASSALELMKYFSSLFIGSNQSCLGVILTYPLGHETKVKNDETKKFLLWRTGFFFFKF